VIESSKSRVIFHVSGAMNQSIFVVGVLNLGTRASGLPISFAEDKISRSNASSLARLVLAGDDTDACNASSGLSQISALECIRRAGASIVLRIAG
jgi:hypothetical protein